ncbi:MAG: AmmeMemoRadiSam system protein B [Spirochaetes bacterium]|nr:AmmeMemoRadiSam system protein B [Spirochaetota bacterium]
MRVKGARIRDAKGWWMSDSMEYPKLRPLEAIPAEEGTVCLRDPAGFSDKLVFLPRELFFIVILFDGSHSILDIQEAYTRKFGELLFSARVREIIDKLDSALFLESERFEKYKENAIAGFKRLKIRPALHAGVAYEGDPAGLKARLDGLFEGAGETASTSEERNEGTMAGIIAPHIDIKRGGGCFAQSYRALSFGSSADTFVVLGISHVPTARRFVLTDKDFETPLGAVPCDRVLTSELKGACGTDFYEDEWTHRQEHSVEFQAVFLRYLYPEKKIRIVPVLCSSREDDYLVPSLGKDPEFAEFTQALADAASKRKDRLCFIASVDLAHLGKRFGQDIRIDPPFLESAKQKDEAMIAHITDLDAEGFLGYIVKENDSRNVCGVPAIYAFLKLVDAKRAELFGYEQSVENETGSVVTFMSAGFYRE